MYYDAKESGQRIQKVRKLLGYTQADVAAMIGISTSHYGKIEVGKSAPSIDVMVELAEQLHLSLDYMLLGKEPQNDVVKHKVRSMIEFLSAVEKEL